MNKVKKSISATLLIICLIIIMADYDFFPRSHTHAVITCNAAQGIADHFEHSHSHTSVYNVNCNELKSRTAALFPHLDFIPDSEERVSTGFTSSIWQPPRI
ncbi:MAG: hypothetical protein CVT93_07180 [Bacteroidetes bacterium HGW-Bacteroidetes-10]|nr:MAG: hypothetical protein CVT93_07180 [Bacteroidetes bacterium HGW-Bacteroidetes-10]